MNRISLPRAQRGVTLVVGLVMLVLITLMVTTAFMLSNTNLKAVGNMQFRDQAVAAANYAIEKVLSTPFTTEAPAPIPVDLNNDGATDYSVAIATPSCIRVVKELGSGSTGTASSVTLGISPSIEYYNTVWDIDATVTDASSGASIRLRQGFRVRLNQSQCDNACGACS